MSPETDEIHIDMAKVEGLTRAVLKAVGTYAAEHGLKPSEVVLAIAEAIAYVVKYAEESKSKRVRAELADRRKENRKWL